VADAGHTEPPGWLRCDVVDSRIQLSDIIYCFWTSEGCGAMMTDTDHVSLQPVNYRSPLVTGPHRMVRSAILAAVLVMTQSALRFVSSEAFQPAEISPRLEFSAYDALWSRSNMNFKMAAGKMATAG
jgi:hypothetical protein